MVVPKEKPQEKFEVQRPFSDFLGNQDLKLLLILLAIDPSLSGMIIKGSTGTGKSLILKLFRQLKIPAIFNRDCEFNCSSSSETLCEGCYRERLLSHTNNIKSSHVPIIKMPVYTSLDNLIGNLDLQFNFRPGILGKVNNGYLVIDDFHLLTEKTKFVLLNTWQRKLNSVQRNTISLEHPSNFCLISTCNPVFYDENPSWMDRFAFSYHLHYDQIVETHIDIINQNLNELDAQETTQIEETYGRSSSLVQEIIRSRSLLSKVSISSDLVLFIAKICSFKSLDGVRADITFVKGAKALASFHNRTYVTREDILFLITPILSHRLSVKGLNELMGSLDDIQTSGRDKSRKKDLEQEFPSDFPQKKKKIPSFFSIIEKIIPFLSILFVSFVISALLVRFFFTPRVFMFIFGILSLWGFGSFLLYIMVRRRKKLLLQYRKEEDQQETPPDVSSFSKVKTLHLTETTKEDTREFKKKPEIDIEEDKSTRGMIFRFIGLQKRRGMITLTRYQRYWIYIYGIFMIFISIILYTILIIYLPTEIWVAILFLLLCLLTLGFLQQYNQEKWRIRRVADIGASSEETSAAIDGMGIGSHISPTKNQNRDHNLMEEYGRNMWQKLSDLNVVDPETEKIVKNRLMIDTKSEDTRKSISRIIGERLPQERGLTDTKYRSQVGKRALSLSSSQTGRIVGSKPFKESPKNIHIMATIMNALRHQKRRKAKSSTKKIEIKLADVHEKVYCARVSATIIFVLDLSESIMNVINSVSASVNWLSRQAYLYRDRVGLVVLQKTQAKVIQAPTSNLNLVKRKLQELEVSGSTPLPSGIQKSLDLIRIDRIRSNNETIPMIVLITDGASNMPLLTDPITGIKRDKPISSLGIDLAIKMSINDCLILGQQIKKDKISLAIFSTNIQGMNLLQKYRRKGYQTPYQFLDTLMKTSDFFQGKQFIQLWSYTLLKTMQDITGGHLFFLTKELTDNNFETLRIARSKIIASING